MPDTDAVAPALHMLADATRLKILLLLAEGELNVSEICDRIVCPQPTASHHLGLLRMTGWVQPRRQGKMMFYRLTSAKPAAATIRVNAGAATILVERR